MAVRVYLVGESKGTILRLKEFSYGDLILEEILLIQLQIMELLYSLLVQNLMDGWHVLLVSLILLTK